MRYIAYVDMDAYYVSCEIRDRPELAEAPVIVGPAPTGPESRGVVLSASYAARKFGVRSALPVGLAAQRCPQAVWIPPDFEKYGRIAGEIRGLLAPTADRMVPMSIDEAALEIAAPGPSDVEAWARATQELIRSKLRLPCSIGASPFAVVAKIASDRAKPGGIRVVPPEATRGFLAPLPVSAIPGIGPKSAQRLEESGIRTIADLGAASPDTLRRVLGQGAPAFRALARGTPGPELGELPEDHGPRQRSLDRTLGSDTRAAGEVRDHLSEMAEELAGLLAEEGFRYQAVTVRLRWSDFTQAQHGRQLPAAHEGPAALTSEALRLAGELLARERAEHDRAVRRISLAVGALVPRRGHQRSLDGPAQPRG